MTFTQALSPIQLTREFAKLDKQPSLAMVCINDDQPDSADPAASGKLWGEWMENHWGGWRAGWEKKGMSWMPEEFVEPEPEVDLEVGSEDGEDGEAVEERRVGREVRSSRGAGYT